MIYKVMERIINQEIPKVVINSPDYRMAPFSNKLKKGTETHRIQREQDSRYARIIDIFKARKGYRSFNPVMNTASQGNFHWEMEISTEEVEALFDTYLRSPEAYRTRKDCQGKARTRAQTL